MNKHVLIPHEQYESFKKFLADSKEERIAQSKQETVVDNTSDNHKVDIRETIDNGINSNGEIFGSAHTLKIINLSKWCLKQQIS